MIHLGITTFITNDESFYCTSSRQVQGSDSCNYLTVSFAVRFLDELLAVLLARLLFGIIWRLGPFGLPSAHFFLNLHPCGVWNLDAVCFKAVQDSLVEPRHCIEETPNVGVVGLKEKHKVEAVVGDA